jgi:hypothetical protein
MSGNQVRLANGELWTSEKFLDHYLNRNGTLARVAAPPSPVIVDRRWYMDEGPGRYYHPGMFPIIRSVNSRNDLAPGAYDLWQLAPKGGKDDSVNASISHYFVDPGSEDYVTRALVFGNESARVSGQVVVNPDGSKTFHNIEIRPYDTDFNFKHKTLNPVLETARELGRRKYDPESQGISYDIKFPTEGRGRVYYPFTDSQLDAALQAPPKDAPPGLLPSVTPAPPPFLDQQQNPGQTKVDSSPSLVPGQPGSPAYSLAGLNSANSDVSNWIAGLAGVDPSNPTRPASQASDRLRGLVSNQPMPDWPIPPPIFNPR